MSIEIEVTLNIKGHKVTLTKEEAKTLFYKLGSIFPNENASPLKILPYNPYRPYTTQDIFISNKTSYNIDL